jgi:hypothetical protein
MLLFLAGAGYKQNDTESLYIRSGSDAEQTLVTCEMERVTYGS